MLHRMLAIAAAVVVDVEVEVVVKGAETAVDVESSEAVDVAKVVVNSEDRVEAIEALLAVI